MPLPVCTTILFAAASIAIIFERYFHIRAHAIRSSFFFVAMLLAGYQLSSDQIPSAREIGRSDSSPVWNGDALARSEQWLILAFGLLAGLAILDSSNHKQDRPDRCGFLLFLVAGLMLIAGSNDFLSLGLSLEIVNLALAGLRRYSDSASDRIDRSGGMRTWRSSEGWINWLSSVWIWFGIAILANTMATTRFDTIRAVLIDAYDPGVDQTAIGAPSKLITLGVGLITMSLFARMGLVPFQLSRLTGFHRRSLRLTGLSICVEQLTGSIILTRLFGSVFVGMDHSLITLMITVCLASFILSGAMAVRALAPCLGSIFRWVASLVLLQNAWLVIGLMIVSIELRQPEFRWGAFSFQNETLALIVFTQLSGLLACCGICWTLAYLARIDREVEFLEDLKGLWKISPAASVALFVGSASVIGVPLTAGFWARWLTLLAGHNVHLKSTSNFFTPHEGVRVVMFVGTVATLSFAVVVIRLLREMFLESPLARPTPAGGRGPLIASLIATTVSLLIGIAPDIVLVPLRAISPPRNVAPKGIQKGSGKNPIGWHHPKKDSAKI